MRVVMSYDVVLRGVVWRCVVVWSEEICKDRYNKNTITHTHTRYNAPAAAVALGQEQL
jgi:pyruvate/2-oxoacid:ferredoxin oxidoreductase beta subunit